MLGSWEKKLGWAFILLGFQVGTFSQTPHHQSDTLDAILKRGYLLCGVSQGLTGFSTVDEQAHWQGLDVDFCSAVAAAVLNDASKVKFIPLSAKERFTALQSGDIDLLSRNTSWTFIRDLTLGLSFLTTIYYDGQGFMVPKKSGIKSIKDLNGAIICTNAGTTSELNVADYFQSHQLKYQIITFEKTDETLAAYEAGRCDTYTTDVSGLAAQRIKLANKEDHIILQERISKEPLGPVVREGDELWGKIVKWTLFAMINAEEFQLNRKNIQEKLKINDPAIQRFLGGQGNFGEKIGLKNDWAYQVIHQVGNYQDIFEKNLGSQTSLQLERGLNALWENGGIMYAPPFR